ncbi:TolC family protein [Gluconacetobacter entanii]|uniref:TolC family protein n=1 Tax=Gluconacetobacter entanii TaxID=108528 RepID=A0ABT3K7A1_9PROT|nr:TolC family protein [Gluconacetobacter entanii]MCW4591295.1 TolC family protein [Gluconacetobacter entanii]MCW4595537.1 TolC family protein [Gluconacetobacter entanii]NPC90681.1 TolC family protein [Gluconacetobacter entanii]
MKKKLSRIICLAAIATLGACSPFHTRTPPSRVTVPSRFTQAPAGTDPATDLTTWWRSWNDPALTHVVETALAANPDIRIARDNVLQARAAHVIARSTLYPTVGATGNIGGGGMSWRNPAGLSQLSDGDPATDAHLAGIGASWEPDLFGGRHADSRAARALMLGQQAEYHGMQMLVAADAAENYLRAQGVQRQIDLLDRSIGILQRLRTYTQARFVAGQAVSADVRAVDEKLSLQRARRPLLVEEYDLHRRRLAILSGQAPENAPSLPAPGAFFVPAAPLGEMPDTVLERRPDVLARRDQVEAALDRLKSAKTDLLPRFGLEFFGGDGRLRFDGIPGLSGTGGLIALTTYLPIFTAGRVHARIHAAHARLDAAVAGYDRTVLNALGEVEDAYEARTSADTRAHDLATAVSQAGRNVSDVTGLYEGGQRMMQDILRARLDELDAREQVLRNEDMQTLASIHLARALGGGWKHEADDAPPLPSRSGARTRG